jgi:iron complex transport system substrate-binding protein
MVSRATDARHPAHAWSGSGQLEHPARRIVSLLPSATEIVCALGLADRLVAVTHECDHPAAELKDVPRITSNLLPPELRRSDEIDAAVRLAVTTSHGLYALDESEMARLEPDLVLTQELCQVCAVAYPRVLEAARLAGGGPGPMVVSLEPHSIDDVFATIRLAAGLAGVEERGIGLVTRLTRRLDAVRLPARRPRVAYAAAFSRAIMVPTRLGIFDALTAADGAGDRNPVGADGPRSLRCLSHRFEDPVFHDGQRQGCGWR